MESLTPGPNRFSVSGLREKIGALVDSILRKFAELSRNSGESADSASEPEIEASRAEVVEDVDLVLEDEDIFADPEPNRPSAKRIAVKAAGERRRAERLLKAELRQHRCIGERKHRRNHTVSMHRRAGRFVALRKNS